MGNAEVRSSFMPEGKSDTERLICTLQHSVPRDCVVAMPVITALIASYVPTPSLLDHLRPSLPGEAPQDFGPWFSCQGWSLASVKTGLLFQPLWRTGTGDLPRVSGPGDPFPGLFDAVREWERAARAYAEPITAEDLKELTRPHPNSITGPSPSVKRSFDGAVHTGPRPILLFGRGAWGNPVLGESGRAYLLATASGALQLRMPGGRDRLHEQPPIPYSMMYKEAPGIEWKY
jgi:hypothetical protein